MGLSRVRRSEPLSPASAAAGTTVVTGYAVQRAPFDSAGLPFSRHTKGIAVADGPGGATVATRVICRALPAPATTPLGRS